MLPLLLATDSGSSSPVGLWIAGAVAGLALVTFVLTQRGRAAVGTLFRGTSMQSISAAAAQRAQEMESFNNVLRAELQHQKDDYDSKLAVLRTENADLRAQIGTLRDMVTGKREIEALTTLVGLQHGEVMGTLGGIAAKVGAA